METTANLKAKKVSERTIEKINSLTPDELVKHGVLQPARVSGFICPLCGSGGGPKGTGMQHNKKIADHTSFTCFSCKNAFNVLKLCALHYDMDMHKDFRHLVEKICAEFKIPIEYDDYFLGSTYTPKKSRKRAEETTPPAELKYIQEDLKTSTEFLAQYLSEQKDSRWRGFDFDFLVSHGCTLMENWSSPTCRANNQRTVSTMRMLIPAGESSYLARLVQPLTNLDASFRAHIQEKMHAGRKVLFNAAALNCGNEPVFVFEGYLDAMSAELAGFKAVALGGRAEGRLLVEAVDALKVKPQLIILFDADKAGRESAPELHNELLRIKCPCVIRFLASQTSNLDANEILETQGVEILRARLQGLVNESVAELSAVEAELCRKDSAGLSDEDWKFIFSGNHSDMAFARRLEKFCRRHVRWLADQKQWLYYMDGKWHFGSREHFCILPFAGQLSEAMEQNARDKHEVELAEKFQSEKKINAAISLLRSRPSIFITSDKLDTHKNLFNVLNGVINLQSGELLPHAPEHMLTQQAKVNYRRDYRNPVVDKFLASILPDEETRAALLRYLGYAATGEVSEERALFLYGDGGNGKGTLTRTLMYLFGDYATTLQTSSVITSGRAREAGAATTELNPLENCRLAIVEELPQGGILDVAKFKNLTGSDIIPIRKLHQEQRTIIPHFSPILSGNYRPELSDTRDPGLLRRLMNIDFKQSFTGKERDPHLKRKLVEPDALSGFLTLIVEAAKTWYEEGLLESDEMKKATLDFVTENDFIGESIQTHCELGPEYFVSRRQLLALIKREYADECFKLFGNRDRAIVEAIKRIPNVFYRRGPGGGYHFYGIRIRRSSESVQPVKNEMAHTRVADSRIDTTKLSDDATSATVTPTEKKATNQPQ